MGLSKEFKIGAVMLAAVAAMIIGVQYLKGSDIFNRSKTFYGIYDHVSGLGVGSPVTINGFKVGQVKNIELYRKMPGKVLVTMVVTNREFEFSRDSKARIESMDLMGAKTISIRFGESTALAQNGDTLATAMEAGLMDEVNAQIAPLKLKTESMVASIDSVMTVMESILKEDAQPNLEASFVSMRKTLESLERTSNNLDGLLSSESARLKSIMRNVESITANFSSNNDQLNNIIKNFSSLTDTLVQADIASVVTNAARAVETTTELMQKVNLGEGTLGMLINNDSLYTNLASASMNLDLLMEDIRLNPKKYVSFSIIERKDKGLKLSDKELKQLKELLKKE